MDINEAIAGRLRELRKARGWSLEALAERSTVSRANISLIERGQSSPTATVLDKLATALEVSLASLFESPQATVSDRPSPLYKADEQQTWRDPASGYVRRNLSPPVSAPIQLVEVTFPPKKSVFYEMANRDSQIHQQIWVIEGAMSVTAGETHWQLNCGDCLAMQLNCPIRFHNPTNTAARYLVALTQNTSGNQEN